MRTQSPKKMNFNNNKSFSSGKKKATWPKLYFGCVFKSGSCCFCHFVAIIIVLDWWSLTTNCVDLSVLPPSKLDRVWILQTNFFHCRRVNSDLDLDLGHLHTKRPSIDQKVGISSFSTTMGWIFAFKLNSRRPGPKALALHRAKGNYTDVVHTSTERK